MVSDQIPEISYEHNEKLTDHRLSNSLDVTGGVGKKAAEIVGNDYFSGMHYYDFLFLFLIFFLKNLKKLRIYFNNSSDKN